MFTPIAFAYTGSRACSASINAATPPNFCTSAIACRATVVLPDDSGPYISIILPLGSPPTPRAKSRVSEPVDTALTCKSGLSPSLLIDSSPHSFLIWERAVSSAFFLASASVVVAFVFSTFHSRFSK